MQCCDMLRSMKEILITCLVFSGVYFTTCMIQMFLYKCYGKDTAENLFFVSL